MRSFIANKNDSGQRLDKFILKTAEMPKSLMYRFLRTGHIKVNKKKADGGYIISEGDLIAFFIDDSFFKSADTSFLTAPLDIVFENDDIIVINKPSGMKSQPDKAKEASLSEYLKGYLYSKGCYNPNDGHSFTPALCNRLDMNTTGLVIAAKNAEAQRILNQKIKDKEIEKYYRCIVRGTPPLKSDILEGYILKDEKKNKSVICRKNSPNAKYVKTGYEVISSSNGKSLLNITLYTGRSHQIRAHMASVGCPIEGDFKYGGGNGAQKLCAYKLVFNFSTPSGALSYLDGKTIEITPYFNNEV